MQSEHDVVMPAHAGTSLSAYSLKAMLDAYERQLIETALAAAQGNQRRAAASLGLLATTLHEKMKRLGLLPRRRHQPASELNEGERVSAA